MASELKKSSSADKINSPVTAKPTNSNSGGDMQDIQAGIVNRYDECDDSKSNFQVPEIWKQNVNLLDQLDKKSVGKEVSRKDTVTAKPASSDSSGDTEDTKAKVVDHYDHGDDSKSNFQVSEIWKQSDLLDQLDERTASKELSEKDTNSNDDDSHHSLKSDETDKIPGEDEECFDENFDDDCNDDYDVTDDDNSDDDDDYDSHSEMFDDAYSREFLCDLRYLIMANFDDDFDFDDDYYEEDDDDYENMSVDDGIDDDESDCVEGEEDIGTDDSINYESESGYSNEEDFMYDNYEGEE